jgi:hypothetical protein
VPSDENSLTIKKTAVPFLIAVRDKLTHGELTGVVIDVLAFCASIDMTSTLECTLRCGHVGSNLPSFDLYIWHPKVLVTFESLSRGTAGF